MRDSLYEATEHWTALTVTRTHENDNFGRALFESDAAVLGAQGYRPATSAADRGDINVGRTVAGAALTSGLSLLFGASRESGDLVVTFTRAQGDSALEEVEEKFRKSR